MHKNELTKCSKHILSIHEAASCGFTAVTPSQLKPSETATVDKTFKSISCMMWLLRDGFTSGCDRNVSIFQLHCNRHYAYDVTEGRPGALGVKRGTATCAIAKHAASGPTPACHTAGLARARALTERLSANALCQHNTCAQRNKS